MLLKLGSRGREVKSLQAGLKLLGYNILVDGIFGKQTEKVVKEFQKKMKLKVDGIVGKMTKAALDREISKATRRHRFRDTQPPPSPPQPKPSKVVVLDVQHLNKRTHQLKDRGAVHKDIVEADYNLRLAHAIRARCKKAKVIILTDDVGRRMDYGERHRYVESLKPKPNLYVAMHLNSALKVQNPYSLFKYIANREENRRLSEVFGEVFRRRFQRQVKVVPFRSRLERGIGTVRGMKTIPAVLSEPFFVQEGTLLKANFDKIVDAYCEAITKF